MLIQRLHKIGVTSDVMNILGLASIGASIITWFRAKKDDPGNGQRSGIFVGLWAPTFFVLGSGLATIEQGEAIEEAL